jgi:hypothetical protein
LHSGLAFRTAYGFLRLTQNSFAFIAETLALKSCLTAAINIISTGLNRCTGNM